MAANIETRDGRALMFYVEGGGVPWHRTGTSVVEAQNSEEALELAGQGWAAEYGEIWAGPDKDHLVLVPDRRAILRSLDGAVLGDVSSDYRIIQNRRQYKFLDSLFKDGILKFDTGGSLRDGKRIFMSARLGDEQQVAGETAYDYLMATSTHDGSGAFQVVLSRVRPVCENTVNLSLATGKELVRVVHSGDIERQFADAEQTVAIINATRQRLTDWQNALAAAAVDGVAVAAVAGAVFPAPAATDEPAKDELTRVRREAAIAVFRAIYDAEADRSGPTGYALANAVTGYADHKLVVRDGGDGGGRLLSMIGGRTADFKRIGLAAVATATGLTL